ncbi:hypothetical protein NA57DRAFT_79299 [Rhizodiscina lignyota]|uniref:SnoaL-like domain-containing protein n=1 Tax=Rhizodiscina lignyota TaxID=1504668 RepID=A0A9P4IA96_9PEZI|nr:hypothetical protein NA57DRAFT_79299 [Rhizodiscina lignyota]
MAYPSKEQIKSIFGKWTDGDQPGFFTHVADNVNWTVESKTALGGTYTSKSDFRTATTTVMGDLIHPDTPFLLRVINVIGGGDEEWAAVELLCDCKTKNMTDYKQTYCWVTKWKLLSDDAEGKIVEVRAYLDTALVDKVVDEHQQQKRS